MFHPEQNILHTMLEVLVGVLNFIGLKGKYRDDARSPVPLESMPYFFNTSFKLRYKPQLFLLTLLSEVYESCCRSQFHSMTLKLFFGYLEEGTAINLLIF